ncbi:MAG TPA: polysaccharide biosynthesis/export family protein [Alphaproteobacteria bacterium]|nr:polysaccharide biosynthesis/export family protein [Alphaproteobacteria bacterium]
MRCHILAFAVLLLTAGCSPTLDSAVDRPAAFAPWTDVAEEYRFRPGDEMDVRLLYNPEISDRVRVAPDGRISLALIGSVQAEGKTVDQLGADLRTKFAKEVRRPDVLVIGRQFESQRIFIGGEVTTPGVITVPGRLGVLEAILTVGGFRDTAWLSQVVLIRRSQNGQPMLRTVDLNALITTGQKSEDVPLQPYDIVFVPRTPIADIDLFVTKYIRGVLPFDSNFTYAVNAQTFLPK